MATKMTFLGTAAIHVETADGKHVLMDPYLNENPVSPVKVQDLDHLDLLLVTHAAYDHLGDAEQVLRKFPDLYCVCGADVRSYLSYRGIEPERLRAVPWGMKICEAGVTVRPVYSRHWSFIETPDHLSFSSIPLGFIIDSGPDVRIYNAGDTCIFSDMKLYGELYKPTIGFINVGVPENHQGAKHGVPEYLTGEMDAEEAALAAQWLGLDYAIPVHHDNPELPEIKKFKELLDRGGSGGTITGNKVGPKAVVLSPGESLTV
jgi:L-ascorbate metabolism protein UlaG (beta-lactamase superfamily)